MNFDFEGTFALNLILVRLRCEETSEERSGTGNRSIHVRRSTTNPTKNESSLSISLIELTRQDRDRRSEEEDFR